MRRVTVAVSPPYDVVVGPGALGTLPDLVADRERVAVVTQEPVAALHGPAALAALAGRGRAEDDVRELRLPGGEAGKTMAAVEALCRALAGWGLRRGDAVVALGGGVVGDAGGFAAAVYHRGVAVVQVPTTLLAMVDAAIGGKTAVNLPEGKNLVGAFHQPIAVVADVTTLASLPDAEYRSGLGEVAKYALMPAGGAVARLLDRSLDAVLARDPVVLTDLVADCAAIKGAVVAEDPEERTGTRAALNYGHTLAHALETSSDYRVAHGEAVAVGLVFAAELARALERVDAAAVDAVRRRLAALGLPTAVPDDADRAELLVAMRRDKKTRATMTFVLPGPRGLELVDDPPLPIIERALAAVGVGG
jgi:3-dehydroquinate synthase